jgi:hypothetical protein
MSKSDRSRIGFALVLILAGVWFLAVQFIPGLQSLALGERTWPLIVVALGVLMAVMALITWIPGLLVPACILGGIGGLLYWQNATDNWASWAYAWALIPGFVGVGVFFSSLLEGKLREAVTGGGWLILISLIMFSIFGSFLGGPILLGVYWPVLLILLGVIVLVQALVGRGPAKTPSQ